MAAPAIEGFTVISVNRDEAHQRGGLMLAINSKWTIV
jgi:hypothetical protein